MKHNIFQVISAIVGVISFGWGVYQYSQRQYEKEITGGTIVSQLEQIIGLRKEVSTLNEMNKFLQHDNDSLMKVVASSRKLTDQYKTQSEIHKAEVEQLKTQLDEKVIIDLTDDEHFEFFLNWTK